MKGDAVIRRQAIVALRAREAVGHPLDAAERAILVELANAGRDIPVGLTIESTLEDPIGRVFIERPRPANPKRVADLQGSLFEREAA